MPQSSLATRSPLAVLVADDDATTRNMLEGFLREWGYKPHLCHDGASAWQALCQPDGPALAIIDWMMPGMDGIDVIQAIRSADMPHYVYTLILTGHQEENALIEGLKAGGDDFITKPFDARELKCRLAVGARVVRMDAKIRRYAQHMEELAAERAAQLVHADRLSALGVMAAGVAHEINNPCTAISSNMQLLERIWAKLGPAIEKAGPHLFASGLSEAHLEFCRAEMPGIIQGSRNGVQRITKIVRSLKIYAHKEGSGLQSCDLNACIQEALVLCAGPLKRHMAIEEQLDPALPRFLGDAQQMEQVLVNLIVNAADALAGRHDATLTISTNFENQQISVRIADNGPGIPAEARKHLFAPFYTTKPQGQGTGLGLSICQSIMESFNGTITASNQPQGGACFLLTLPAK